jgi:hypothetical protein
MFRDDAERTGFAEGTRIGTRAAVAWTLPDFNNTAYPAVKGSPSVADGVL